MNSTASQFKTQLRSHEQVKMYPDLKVKPGYFDDWKSDFGDHGKGSPVYGIGIRVFDR